MTPWRKVSDYAITNGAQSISLKSGTFCLHEGNAYTKHSAEECECVVAATYPDAESMKSYLATGGLSGGRLLEKCRAEWVRRGLEAVDRVRGEKVAA